MRSGSNDGSSSRHSAGLPDEAMARRVAASKGRAGRRKARPPRRTSPAAGRNGRRWSGEVTRRSNALTLERGIFTSNVPARIAASLKRSAERSKRRKADPFRSALSMLSFYINRAGRNFPARRKKILMQAKDELRRQFGKE